MNTTYLSGEYSALDVGRVMYAGNKRKMIQLERGKGSKRGPGIREGESTERATKQSEII